LSDSVLALCCCYKLGWNTDGIVSDNIKEAPLKGNINNIIKGALAYFINLAERNNGIKDDNIRKLIVPTGIEYDQLDSSGLAALNSYGAERGAIAHSSAMSITKLIDPKDEYTIVHNELVPFIKKFDAKITTSEPKLAYKKCIKVVESNIRNGFNITLGEGYNKKILCSKEIIETHINENGHVASITSIGPESTNNLYLHVVFEKSIALSKLDFIFTKKLLERLES
tara:strand:+ start:2024 stop:2701 length:678 start_codon:yes stop_codon:yes gene_type:complete